MNCLVTSSVTQTMFLRTMRLLLEVRPPTLSVERVKSQSTRVQWCWIQSGEPSACSSFISTQRQKLRHPRGATCLPAVSAELQHRPTEVNWLPSARKANISSSQHSNVNVKLKSCCATEANCNMLTIITASKEIPELKQVFYEVLGLSKFAYVWFKCQTRKNLTPANRRTTGWVIRPTLLIYCLVIGWMIPC